MLTLFWVNPMINKYINKLSLQLTCSFSRRPTLKRGKGIAKRAVWEGYGQRLGKPAFWVRFICDLNVPAQVHLEMLEGTLPNKPAPVASNTKGNQSCLQVEAPHRCSPTPQALQSADSQLLPASYLDSSFHAHNSHIINTHQMSLLIYYNSPKEWDDGNAVRA